MEYDTYTIPHDCGKIHSPGLASRNYLSAKAALNDAAFSVCAYPYLYNFDTVCMSSGFVPPVCSGSRVAKLDVQAVSVFSDRSGLLKAFNQGDSL
jgi:hypothetical protein